MKISKIIPLIVWGFVIFCFISLWNEQKINHAATVHLNKAEAYLQKNKVTKAIAEVSKAISVDESKYYVYTSAISLYNENHRPKEALVLLDRLITLSECGKLDQSLSDSQISLLYSSVISLCCETKNSEVCTRIYREAGKKMLNDPVFLNGVGYCYAECGVHLDDALRLVKKANKLIPNESMIIDSLGWVLYKMGKYDDAIDALKRAVELTPNQADLRYHLGAAYAKAGNMNLARVELNKALLLKEHHHDAENLLHSLRPAKSK